MEEASLQMWVKEAVKIESEGTGHVEEESTLAQPSEQ